MSYSTSFYKNRTANTSEASNIILKSISKSLDNINSIFDIGCGSGAWLETAEDIFKADKLIGLEGEWLPKEILNKLNKELNGKIQTNISKLKNYCKAEEYHQKYIEKNR